MINSTNCSFFEKTIVFNDGSLVGCLGTVNIYWNICMFFLNYCFSFCICNRSRLRGWFLFNRFYRRFFSSVSCGNCEALLLKNFWIKEKTPITTGIWAKPPAITVDCEYIFWFSLYKRLSICSLICSYFTKMVTFWDRNNSMKLFLFFSICCFYLYSYTEIIFYLIKKLIYE